jgi:hypothetical protein
METEDFRNVEIIVLKKTVLRIQTSACYMQLTLARHVRERNTLLLLINIKYYTSRICGTCIGNSFIVLVIHQGIQHSGCMALYPIHAEACTSEMRPNLGGSSSDSKHLVIDLYSCKYTQRAPYKDLAGIRALGDTQLLLFTRPTSAFHCPCKDRPY